MKKINFVEFIKVCEEFISNPSDSAKREAYNEMLSDIVVRSYLPMDEKVLALYKAAIDSNKSMDLPAAAFTGGLELALLFDGLLTYTNIDNDISTPCKTYEVYDIIYRSGAADYILQFCKPDYERLVRMMERTISYENLLELTQMMQKLDTLELKESIAEFKEIQSKIDPDVLKNLTLIMQYNDPMLHQLKEDVVDTALEELDNPLK